ncbi:flagellar biosynthesis protein FlhF [Treponema sp. OMZ 792]|uniref:flagellar biosynthesis protein FlhF n=1 Tax=unclassified Treponema TaxID=2638727 RepID=UPI0020A3034B|nr:MULTISPECIES: flagellar biosynthesis protein FlhF [unclassified Treponema]UTC74614.1 flagellar biosynthesis protein FlhF [Treponema sp. OMZ 792]UTC77109.1 flagellar biosynthesis protein FlhF [Treponema sp. OMZ 799]UTC81011.1 flagellar biosynthesis protein FlhF [Treponema sp. OMZ 798]
METFVEEASTYEKCIQKIHEQYGPNIVVTRREVKSYEGFFNLFNKKTVRLTFTIQDGAFVPKLSDEEEKPVQLRSKPLTNYSPMNVEEERLKIIKLAASQSEEMAEKMMPYIEKLENQTSYASKSDTEYKELKNLAQTVERLVEEIKLKNSPSQEHENIVKIAEILQENDFTLKYIRSIKEKISNNLSLAELNDFELVQKKVLEWIASSIQIKLEDVNKDDSAKKQKLIALVGPTGIGKTTTLAKLAAYYILAVSKLEGRSLDVRVITLDQFRIGAAFQIKKYCEHMGIPLIIATDPLDLHKYLDLYKDSADIICIDTTGRSPADPEKILEMQKYFDEIEPGRIETHLVVSAVTKAADISEIIKQYSVFDFSSLIVTKLDETAHVGSIISVLDEYKIPVAYITEGQTVPKDIAKASKLAFLRKLTGFSLDYINENFNDEISIVWS